MHFKCMLMWDRYCDIVTFILTFYTACWEKSRGNWVSLEFGVTAGATF